MKRLLFCSVALFMFPALARAQREGWLQLQISGPIHYVVTDSQGRRSGRDPRTHATFKEIPNMGYGYAGVDSHDPNVQPISYWEFGFNTHVVDPEYRQEFVAMIIGTGKGTYSGGCYWSVNGKGGRADIKGVIDSNQTVSFTFTIAMDTSDLFAYTKLVPPKTLRQDLENSYKLDLLGNRPFYMKLLKEVNQIERRLDRKDSSKAYQELEGLRKELTKVYSEMQKEKGKMGRPRFITPEAFNTLNEDITAMQNSLTPKKHRKHDERDKKKKKN